MLILVSKSVFVLVYTVLVAILISASASAQLVSSDLLSCHGGGSAEEAAVEMEGAQRERAIATSKTSPAGRLKYDIHLPGSGRDREV